MNEFHIRQFGDNSKETFAWAEGLMETHCLGCSFIKTRKVMNYIF